MSEDGQPVVYESRRLKSLSILGIFLAALFAWRASVEASPLRWLCLTTSCVIFVVTLFQQVRLGFTSIHISTKGIEIWHWRFSKASFEWSDIVEFFPEQLCGRDYVCFTVSPAFREKMRRKRYAGIHKGMLPDTYGFTAEALAKLLNAQRKSALAELHDQKAPG